MDKALIEFFNKIGFINSDEYSKIATNATFEITKKDEKKLLVLINFSTIPTFEQISILESKKNNVHKTIEIEYRLSNFDSSQLNQLLLLFIKLNAIDSFILESIFRNEKFSINNNELVISYSAASELQAIKQYESKIVSFLNYFCLNIASINYTHFSKEQQINDYKNSVIKESLNNVKVNEEKGKLAIAKKLNTVIGPTIKLNKIIEPMKNVNIEGEIFKIENPGKSKKPWQFYISDYTSSFKVKCFAKVTEWSYLDESYLKTFNVGDWIKAKGNFDNDQYDRNELSCIANKLEKAVKPLEFIRADDSPKPRIELFSHTKMSAFDGICSCDEIIKLSKNFNAPAVGFADRGNVQCYPAIAHAADTNKQKILYGIEIDKLQKNINLAINVLPNQNLQNQTYVVFDIETTGLCAIDNDITEFGAVRISNGVVVDKFDTFIKPNQPIPNHIEIKTHITNEMVKNAPPLKKVLPDIVKWIGNDILVAHNGINFDIRFMNEKLRSCGMDELKNTLIDTMQVSRAVNVEMTHHSLGTICKSLKIPYDDSTAHRADFDAQVLSEVWKNMLTKLKVLNINTIDQINIELQNNNLYKSQFPSYCQLYAKNQAGLKEIYTIVSTSSTDTYFGHPKAFSTDIYNMKNIIKASSPYDGDVWDNVINGSDEELKKCINFYDYIFIAPISELAHEVNRMIISFEDIKKGIKRLVNICNELNKPVCAVSNCYYASPWDKQAHTVYVFNKMLGGRPHRLFKYNDKNDVMPDLFYRNTKEMLEDFSFIDNEKLINEIVIENTYKFANEIEDVKIFKKGLFAPKWKDVEQNFSELVRNTMKKIYGDNPNEYISKRVERELNIINGKGYSIIYWISHLLVKKSLEDGYVVGSRGSVGSSAAAFFSGISEVNPLPPHFICPNCKYHEFVDKIDDGFDLESKICPKCGKPMKTDGHNIPFESFLGTEGAEKIPDIDLNFSGTYQPIAHKFIHDMFGKQKSFKAGTILTVADKTAYGYIKNYFEETSPELQPRDAEIAYLARKCIDVKRTNGQHAGGMVVVPEDCDLTDFTPYNYPPDGDTFGWYSTHFDYHSFGDNLLKFDILGHDFPTMLKYMKESSKCDPSNVSFQDKKVIELFYSLKPLGITPDKINGQTIGTYAIPECGTNFAINLIKDAKPKNFADLIRISGLAHGTDVWEGNAKQLLVEKNLQLSDVICCREDMVQYLESMGLDKAVAFTIAEKVRKGKGVDAKNADIMRKANIPDWYIESCNKIKYLFPKAHATAYMIASYICGWYKIYYPIDFYLSYFSIKPDVFDVATIAAGPFAIKEKLDEIQKRLKDPKTKSTVTAKEQSLIDIFNVALEAYARGIKFKNINLEKSDAENFVKEGNDLIIPFKCIDGLGIAVAKSIIEARKEKPFRNKEDLSNRTLVSSKVMTEFINLGILDGMEESDQMSLSSIFD